MNENLTLTVPNTHERVSYNQTLSRYLTRWGGGGRGDEEGSLGERRDMSGSSNRSHAKAEKLYE